MINVFNNNKQPRCNLASKSLYGHWTDKEKLSSLRITLTLALRIQKLH